MAERLQKILSAAGIASRRTAETLIEQGRVTVNGKSVTALGTKADPDTDDIRVDGRRVKGAQRRRYHRAGRRSSICWRRVVSRNTSTRSAGLTTTPKGCSC
jgi:ribosomal protein S4